MIPVIVLLIWCRAAGRAGGGSETLLVVTRRMVWNHLKLALCVVLGFFVMMWLFAANSRKQASGLRHPIEWLVQAIVGFFGAIALGLAIFSSYVYDEHKSVHNRPDALYEVFV